jgi:hypothetical protein
MSQVLEELIVHLRQKNESLQKLLDDTSTALTDAVIHAAEAKGRVARLEEALTPFATFADRWDANPIRGLDDVLYAIHSTDEQRVELRLSDCKKARKALNQKD